jgi:hypothetical protein
MTGYCDLLELQEALRIGDSEDSEALTTAIAAASGQIDAICGRTFGRADIASTRDFEVFDSKLLLVDDIATDAGLTVNDEPYSGLYRLDPLNALVLGRPVTGLRAETGRFYLGEYVRVAAVWGWPSIPPAIRQATIILAGRYFKRQDSLLGVAGFGDLGAVMVRNVDPDVEALVAKYRRGDTGYGFA